MRDRTKSEIINYLRRNEHRPPRHIPRPKLPLRWQIVMIILTCLCTFGNHWSNGLIVALKTTIVSKLKINNSQFATLVAVTNLINTFLCVGIGFCIDKWGGAYLSAILASFHFVGTVVMAGSATNNFNSYHVLIAGKVLAAIGDGSLDNAQHRIFSTYFAPGRGFAFSIGMIWSMANLAQFTGQSTANIITRNLGSYGWSLWISACISLFSLFCAISVVVLDRHLCKKYDITDQTTGKRHRGSSKSGTIQLDAIKHLPLTFWLVVLFAVFENAGVQSFVSISTQFAQQRLGKGAVVGGWVSSFYLLLPVGLTPFIGIFIDAYGNRASFLFLSGITFFVSMLLLKLSHTVPTFISAYVFYAISQAITPSPQAELVRNIIPDPQYFATGFAIKKSVVQASIVIITTAAGKLQDLSPTNSLNPAVTLWLAYAACSVVCSGLVFAAAYDRRGKRYLPAARLSQVAPAKLKREVNRLWTVNANLIRSPEFDRINIETDLTTKEKEKLLKSPSRMGCVRWLFPVLGSLVIVLGWIMFGLGISWGVHGSVIAGTVGD